jgi:hypothetical protein
MATACSETASSVFLANTLTVAFALARICNRLVTSVISAGCRCSPIIGAMSAIIEDQGMVKKEKGDARLLWPIARGITSIVALWAFISGLLVFLHGGRLGTALPLVFLLASYLLMTIPPKSWRDWFLFLFVFPGFTSLANRAERKAGGPAKQYQSLDWPVVAYFVIVGLGCDWAIAFLWFSRRYAPFSGLVVGTTGVILSLYVGTAVLVGVLTVGNWWAARRVFLLTPVILGFIVLSCVG